MEKASAFPISLGLLTAESGSMQFFVVDAVLRCGWRGGKMTGMG
jgi:hypothetical protein